MIADALLRQLSERIVAELGLWYPPERWSDLERGFRAAAPQLGFDDAHACLHWLLTSPLDSAQTALLASHLTIGETYFCREKAGLDALRETILPPLLAARRGGSRHLRLWSAACCTGEEPYSLAMLLVDLLPDLAEWDIALLATDINPDFLRRAAAGIYSAWSFRGVPVEIQERFFSPTEDGQFAISPALRRMVTFARHNLVAEGGPAVGLRPDAMDVIVCRNVLMYFAPEQAARTAERLGDALVEGGWLLVGAAETSAAMRGQFEAVNLPGVTVYRRGSAATSVVAAPVATSAPSVAPIAAPPAEPPAAPAVESVPPPPTPPAAEPAPDPPDLASLARLAADRGALVEARALAERLLAADSLAASSHYLLATIQQEQGELAAAESSYRRALYLDPQLAMAHFALGHLARRSGRPAAAEKQFQNALVLLSTQPDEELVPESEGLTTVQLQAIVRPLT